MTSPKPRIILHALIITAVVLTVNLNTRGMLDWEEEKFLEALELHETDYPFSLRPFTSVTIRSLTESFGLTVRQAFIASQYSLLFVLLISFDYLLVTLALSRRRRIVGLWALGLSFPILGVHFIPNFTWDDLWGYIALTWMAVFLIRGRLYPAALCLAFVAIAKENQLVALPAVYIFRDCTRPVRSWLIPMLIPVAVFVGYRIFAFDGFAQESFSNLAFNFSNIPQSRQTIFSLLMSFGAFWVWAGEGLKKRLFNSSLEHDELYRQLALSALVVGGAAVVSTLLLAYARETRLFFTCFVFIIPLALITVYESRAFETIRQYVKSSSKVRLSLIALGFSALGIIVSSLVFPTFPFLPEKDIHRWLFGLHLGLVFSYFVAKRESAPKYFSLAGIIAGLRKIPCAALTLFAASLSLRAVFLVFVSSNLTSKSIWNLFPDTGVYLIISTYFKSSLPYVEYDLLLSGPGYGFIIYTLSGVVGMNGWAHIIVQILISAATSVLIRQLALHLGLRSKVATFAGYVHAFSLTAIYLSCSLLTETWFVFLSTLALLAFISALKSNRTAHYLAFAFLCFSAAMVRSIAQFYPLVLVAIVLVPAVWNRRFDMRALWRPLGFSCLALTLVFLWSARNYATHGVFTVSETGIRAARMYWIASGISESGADGDILQARETWDKEFETRYPGAEATSKARHDFDMSVVRDSLFKYPGRMLRVYASAAWENVTAPSFFHKILAPQLSPLWNTYSRLATRNTGAVIVLLTMMGFGIMAMTGSRQAALFLCAFYVFFAATSGVTFWQASRVFFPAEPFWTIGCATALLWIYEKSKNSIRLLRSR